jgi:queuine tRNA-ribosyltransferase
LSERKLSTRFYSTFPTARRIRYAVIVKFEVIATKGKARAGVLTLPHGTIETPVFMPVGTLATVKAVTQRELEELGAQIILNNAFHLYLRPGVEIVKAAGGVHKFQNWKRPILTDSGGFQVFSLARLRKINDDGVHFQSPVDGSKHFFTPESVIELEEGLGPDIAMVLDDVVAQPATYEQAATAMHRSVAWAARAAKHRSRDDQAVFGIVQGGLYEDLRLESAHATVDIGFDGYAIGGLSVGESPEEMYPMVETCCRVLPAEKPRYLMGVGTPRDLREAVASGVDMFDCVLPTRLARHGVAVTEEGNLNLVNAKHKTDFGPVDASCECPTCREYSRAYLHHLIKCREILASRLLTYHNIHFYLQLMRSLRADILAA